MVSPSHATPAARHTCLTSQIAGTQIACSGSRSTWLLFRGRIATASLRTYLRPEIRIPIQLFSLDIYILLWSLTCTPYLSRKVARCQLHNRQTVRPTPGIPDLYDGLHRMLRKLQ